MAATGEQTTNLRVRDVASWSQSATERRRLASMLVSLFAGATAGSLLLAYARTYAPVLPLAVTILVVATAEFTLRARDAADKRERR